MLKKLGTVSLILVLTTFLTISCGPKDPETPDEDATSTKTTYTPTGNEATVIGVIKFDGTTAPVQEDRHGSGSKLCRRGGRQDDR